MRKFFLFAILFVVSTKLSYAQFATGTNTNDIYSQNSGNVGIGTPTPQNKFSVLGNASFGGADYPYLGPSQYGGITFPRAQIMFSNTNGQNQFYMISNAYLGTNPTGAFLYRNNGIATGIGMDTGDFAVVTSSAGTAGNPITFTNPFIVKSTGNVGIGTATPTDVVNGNIGTLVDINTAGNSNSILVLHSGGLSGSGGGAFSVQSNLTVQGSPFIGQMSVQRAADVTTNRVSGRILFNVNNDGNIITPMAISSVGNVGIGTLLPDQKLTVKGIIHTSEVKVDLNIPGPDYVFKKDYNLPGLHEVKNYINTNHHLSEIPTARQMEQNGINLGDLNMKLLKKVEELTLYILNQDEQNKAQQAEINMTKRQIKILSKSIRERTK